VTCTLGFGRVIVAGRAAILLLVSMICRRAEHLERLGTVAIVGVGLIGGSVGMALRARGLADHVVGIGRDLTRLDLAIRRGAIDSAETDLSRGVAAADVAVICTPVGRIAEDCVAAALHGPAHLLVTDAGSTKAAIVASVEATSGAREKFVGAHPIAGSERSGVEAASADLLSGRCCILAPTERTQAERLTRARAFWMALGCRIHEMSPESHDRALALTSHLPHVISSALSASVPPELLEYSAGAFRDGTRVAASDATLWTEIFLANRRNVLQSLGGFESRLRSFRDALAHADRASLIAWWNDGLPKGSVLAETDNIPTHVTEPRSA
jgi:prephenate dehydrogenase